MSYATITQLQDRHASDVAIIAASETDLQKTVDDASATVDSYLATRYALPLAVVPSVLVRVVCDIAQYLIVGTDGGLMTEERRRRYDDAIHWLRDVAKGVVDIAALITAPVDADGDGVTDPPVQVEMTGEPRLFSRSTLRGVL